MGADLPVVQAKDMRRGTFVPLLSSTFTVINVTGNWNIISLSTQHHKFIQILLFARCLETYVITSFPHKSPMSSLLKYSMLLTFPSFWSLWGHKNGSSSYDSSPPSTPSLWCCLERQPSLPASSSVSLALRNITLFFSGCRYKRIFLCPLPKQNLSLEQIVVINQTQIPKKEQIHVSQYQLQPVPIIFQLIISCLVALFDWYTEL